MVRPNGVRGQVPCSTLGGLTDGRAAATLAVEPRDLILATDAARMLAEARTLDEIRHIGSFAVAARAYARKERLGLDAQNGAGAIAIEAGTRLGEVLAEMRESGQRATGYAPLKVESESGTPLPTLADLGIGRKEAAQAQALAASADAVRGFVARSKAGRKPVTLGLAERVARAANASRDRDEQLGARP